MAGEQKHAQDAAIEQVEAGGLSAALMHSSLLPKSEHGNMQSRGIQHSKARPLLMLFSACLAAFVVICLSQLGVPVLAPILPLQHLSARLAPLRPPFLLSPPLTQPSTLDSAPPSPSASAFHFSPTVRFVSLGDWGRNGTYNQTLIGKQMGEVGRRVQAQFVVSTGDNFYEEGLSDEHSPEFKDSFSQIYSHPSLQLPWFAVLGNHDYYGNVLAQLSPLLLTRDLRWHAFRSTRLSFPLCPEPSDEGKECAQTLDLFMYDTTPLVRKYRKKKSHHLDWRGLNTANWTAQEEAQLQELEGWLRESKATWKIVVGHHPVYSFGHHGNQKEMMQRVDPLLQKYGVHIYMNGHDHNIQHIKRDDSPVHYLTNGGGSKAWRDAAPHGPAPGLQYYWPGQGFAALQASSLRLEVVFYGVRGNILHSLLLLNPSSNLK